VAFLKCFRRLAPPVMATLLLTIIVPAGALESVEPPRPTEYDVKAAFLYNFAKFVKWPEDDYGPTFVVAVLGEDPFGEILDKTFAGKTILDKKVEVRRISALESPARIRILFVGSSERLRLAQVLKALDGSSVLTVSEMEGFTERGGMIAFRLGGDVVRFDINLGEVERARLKMSSQLIRLARNVISKSDGL
jgi:hypothetical protein